MYLKTERLVIRSIKTTDIDDVFEIYQDDATCKYLLYDSWD